MFNKHIGRVIAAAVILTLTVACANGAASLPMSEIQASEYAPPSETQTPTPEPTADNEPTSESMKPVSEPTEPAPKPQEPTKEPQEPTPPPQEPAASAPYSLYFKLGDWKGDWENYRLGIWYDENNKKRSAIYLIKVQDTSADFSFIATEDSLRIEKINESLASFFSEPLGAFLSECALDRQIGWDITEAPEVFYYGEHYISVGYYLRQTYYRGVNHIFFYNTTVDLQTGEVVKLSDLIELNTESIRLIKSGKIIKAMPLRGGGNGDALSLDERRKAIIKRFAGTSYEDFAARLEEASVSYAESPFPPYGKCSFYLIPGNLVIDHILADWESGSPYGYEIRIAVDDIEQFPKVPKW